MADDAAFGAIPLEVVTHQHDLMLDVVREIRELVRHLDGDEADDGGVVGERRRAFYSRVALLAEFLAEHTYIEQTQFLPPVRELTERSGRPGVVGKLEQIEQRIDQLGVYAERVLDLCSDPQPGRVAAAGGVAPLLRFVDVAERMIRREDEVLVPFVERLLGRKSRRLTRLDVALAEAQAANAEATTTEEEPPPARHDIASSA